MPEGSQFSKVYICVQILKWRSPRQRVGIELPGQLKRGKEILVLDGWGSGKISIFQRRLLSIKEDMIQMLETVESNPSQHL